MKKPLLISLIFLFSTFLPADTVKSTGAENLPTFGELIEVHLVPIHVLVRDSKGNPVYGLKRDDFMVIEDGEEKDVTHFAEVKNRASRSVFTSPHGEPGTKPPPPTVPDTEDLLHERYIFYIDNVNIHPLERNRVLNKLNDFVRERIRKGVHGMVVSFDRSLKIHTDFSDDTQLLINKINEQKERTGELLARLSERNDLLDQMHLHKDPQRAIARTRQYAASVHNDMMFTLEAFHDFLLAVKGMEGRKVLIYVCSGLPEIPAYEVFYHVSTKYQTHSLLSESDYYNLHSRYQSIINAANSAGVNLCMIDVSGLRALGSQGAGETRYATNELDDTIETNNLTDPLKTMAEATGGVAVVNTNDFERGFKKIADIVDNYYFLGYQRSRPIEDRFHKIKVKLRKKVKGARLTFKKSFLEKSIHSLMGDKITANLLFPEETNPHEMSISFKQPRIHSKEDKTYSLPMILTIPFKNISMAVQEGRRLARLRVGFAVSDGRDRTEIAWKDHNFDIPEDAYRDLKDKDFTYELSLLIRGGGSIVSVGILNVLDGMESYEVERVFIRPPQ